MKVSGVVGQRSDVKVGSRFQSELARLVGVGKPLVRKKLGWLNATNITQTRGVNRRPRQRVYRKGLLDTDNFFECIVGDPAADECWEWAGMRSHNGYGQVWNPSEDRLVKAHRLAWELYNKKKIRPGFIIMHSCDNKPCINPRHLEEGTRRENVVQAYDRGLIGERKRTTKGFKLSVTVSEKHSKWLEEFRVDLEKRLGKPNVNWDKVVERLIDAARCGG